jgi:hypothetical protein
MWCGMNTPAPNVTFSVRLPRAVRARLEQEAAADQRQLTQLVRKILVDHTRQRRAKPQETIA